MTQLSTSGLTQATAISQDLIIFAHIPKTAGSTINAIVESNYDSITDFYPRKNKPETDIQNWIDIFARKQNSLVGSSRLVRGHIGFGIHEFLNFNRCTYLSVLRHPVDRVISHYYYFARPESESQLITKDMKLEDFIYQQKYILADNFQTRFLSGLGWQQKSLTKSLYGGKYRVKYGKCSADMLACAKRNLSQYIVFGLQSRFEESLKLFQQVFGWQNVNFDTQKNVNHKKPKKQDLDPALIDFIRQENHLDMELYNYALEIYDDQLENLQANFKTITGDSVISYPPVNKRKEKKQSKNLITQAQTQINMKLSEESKAILDQAEQLFNSENYAGAIDKYQQVLKDNPQYIPALNKLAASFKKNNAEEQATIIFERIIQLAPNNDKILTKLARSYVNQGKFSEAISAYKKAIGINAEQPDWVFISLGKALSQTQENNN